MLLSYDKFIFMKENKCSQPSLKMPQPLLLNIERLKLHTFVYHTTNPISVPWNSPSFHSLKGDKKKKKDLKSTLQQHSAFLWNTQHLKYYVHVFFSFSMLDTGFRVCGTWGNNPFKTILEIVFWQNSKDPCEQEEGHFVAFFSPPKI